MKKLGRIQSLFSDVVIRLNSNRFLPISLGRNNDFGTAIERSELVTTDQKICVFICNSAKNNPIGNGYIILIHDINYWSKHPQYVCFQSNNVKTGVLDCSDLTNLKLS